MRTDLMPILEKERSYDRDKFTTRMVTACDLSLIGKSNAEIADLLDVEESTVCIWLGDARAHAYIAAARQLAAERLPDIMAELEKEAKRSLDVAVAIRDSVEAKPEIRLRASFGLLDRAGYSPVQKVLTGKLQELPADIADRMETTLDETKEIVTSFRYVTPNGEDQGSD